MQLEFRGEIWFWKGPAPWYFVTVPGAECRRLESISGAVSYGWGMTPVTVRIGETTWASSLFPKDASYVVPLKAAVRTAESLELGETVTVRITVRG